MYLSPWLYCYILVSTFTLAILLQTSKCIYPNSIVTHLQVYLPQLYFYRPPSVFTSTLLLQTYNCIYLKSIPTDSLAHLPKLHWHRPLSTVILTLLIQTSWHIHPAPIIRNFPMHSPWAHCSTLRTLTPSFPTHHPQHIPSFQITFPPIHPVPQVTAIIKCTLPV